MACSSSSSQQLDGNSSSSSSSSSSSGSVAMVNQLKSENNQILTTLNLTTQQYLTLEDENSVLRDQLSNLSVRITSLLEVIDVVMENRIANANPVCWVPPNHMKHQSSVGGCLVNSVVCHVTEDHIEGLDVHGDIAAAAAAAAPAGEDNSYDGIRDVSNISIDLETGKLLLNNKNSENKRRQTKKLTLESIQPYLDLNMSLEKTALQLGVSRSTLKRAWKELERGPWPSSRIKKRRSSTKGKCTTNSAFAYESNQLNSGTLTTPAPHEHVLVSLDASNQHRPSKSLRTINHETNHRTSDTTLGADKATTTATQRQVHSDARGDGSSSKVVVKATYKEDTKRFEFSCTSGVNELKEEVGKKLNLELSKFKMKYKDEEEELVLMTEDSDLEDCLRLLRSSGSNIVRLTILDLENGK